MKENNCDYSFRFERALSFGDGLFETLYFKKPVLHAFKLHYKRLFKGAEIMGLNLPDEDKLIQAIKDKLKSKKIDEAAVKLVLFRKSDGSVGYQAGSNDTDFVVYVRAFNREKFGQQKIDLRLCHHRLSYSPRLSAIKHTNRIDQVIARNEKNQDGIMLSQENNVIETTSANLLILRKDNFYTPDLKRYGVCGIMREMLIEAMMNLNFSLTHHTFKPSFFKQASEVMIMNSLVGIVAINRIEGVFERKNNTLNDSISTLRNYCEEMAIKNGIKLGL